MANTEHDKGIAERIRLRGHERHDHLQPWWPVLMNDGAIKALRKNVDQAMSDARPRFRPLITVFLKPAGGFRTHTLLPVEAEHVMMRDSLDLARKAQWHPMREVASGQPLNMSSLSWFPDVNFQIGLKAAKARESVIKERYPLALKADVQKYFPSLTTQTIYEGVERNAPGVGAGGSLRMLLRLMRSLDGRVSGLPVTPDLPGLLGTLLLHEVDHKLVREFGDDAVARYMDDIAVGVHSTAEGLRARSLLEAAMAPLGLVLHPVKTQIVTSDRLRLIGDSYDDEIAASNEGPWIRDDEPHVLPRARAKEVLFGLKHSVADRAAAQLAADAPRLINAGYDLARTARAKLKAADGELDAAFAKSLGRSETRRFGNSASLLLKALPDDGRATSPAAARALIEIASDHGVCGRTRSAAAWLAGCKAAASSRGMINSLDEWSPTAARAAVAGARLAGESMTGWLRRCADLQP